MVVRFFGAIFFRFLMVLLLSAQGLLAQLDARLQKSPTDFLDLYQQSSSLKIKPEILMLMDFSGSMRFMMYHPLHFSADKEDKDDICLIKFELTGGFLFIPRKLTVTLTSGKTFDGNTFGSQTSTTLIRPDGSVVTEAIVKECTANTSLDGTSHGVEDVRNWVRAASHVRFEVTDSSNGYKKRTIDLPIGWKILNAQSNGSPLSTLTAVDSVTGATIDYDQNHAFNRGNSIFCKDISDTTTGYPQDSIGFLGSSPKVPAPSNGAPLSVGKSKVTTVYMHNTWYKASYLRWIFFARYSGVGNPYSGKYIVFDAKDAALAGGQGNTSWGQGFGAAALGNSMSVPLYTTAGVATGKYGTQDASRNVLPAETRTQSVKRSVINTWLRYQKDVLMAYRFLDNKNESSDSDAYRYTTNWVNNNSRAVNSADPTTNLVSGDATSGWQLFNNQSLTAINKLANYWAFGATPLTYAMARGLAQFTDPMNIFNDIENGSIESKPLQCMSHFLIFFTDGVDNNGGWSVNTNKGTPYIGSDGLTGNAFDGNAAILADKTAINGAKWWNLFTFAGIAAHLADASLGAGKYMNPPGSYPSYGYASQYLPYAVKGRSDVTFGNSHRVQTMTVGVGLGGQYVDAASPKRTLFMAAAVGDPNKNFWNLSTAEPFTLKDPGDPGQGGTSNSIYFFDGANPKALDSSLDSAFRAAIAISNVNVTTSPNLPFVGGSLANQAYVGTFLPPSSGGALWSGDLLMFPTRYINGTHALVDSFGTPVHMLTRENSGWAASYALDPTGSSGGRLWSDRKLLTRLPGGTALTPFTDVNSGASTVPKAYDLLSPHVLAGNSGATDNDKIRAIQWAAGGNIHGTLDGSNRPTSNRSNIMGDIINSTPVTLEYAWTETLAAKLPQRLASAAAGMSGTKYFRLIMVGDNQGWLHGFGEVSSRQQAIKDGEPLVDDKGEKVMISKAAVDELWAFMPTDFLAHLDQLLVLSNPHRAMVDGPPSIYFLDLPRGSSPTGNGKVDESPLVIGKDATGADKTVLERALVIFGLGKGGRSYYALNIFNPFEPALAWSLVPDEADSIVQDRAPKLALADVKTLVRNMGFSTCFPSVGRVMMASDGKPKDMIFLGGGYSNTTTESQFLTAGKPTPLGRSVLALEAHTGKILAMSDLSGVVAASGAPPGPIAAGLVPFEFILNSGMAQRAYFMDMYGGLWSWDQNPDKLPAALPKLSEKDALRYKGFRLDSSYLDHWTSGNGIRQVYQDDSTLNRYYSTLPSPFLVGYFPGAPHKEGGAVPTAVGICMVGGDRNNPLDNGTGYTNGVPTNFRLTTVFDRQDSALWTGASGGTAVLNPGGVMRDTNLVNLGNITSNGLPRYKLGDEGAGIVTPGDPKFYLAPYTLSSGKILRDTAGTKFGYWINFPAKSGAFIPKGLITPYVVSNVLFYSYFTPTSTDPCAGGSGNTYSNVICNVLCPALSPDGSYCVTGNALSFGAWSGVASGFSLYGNLGVFQAGVKTATGSGGTPGSGTSQVSIEVLRGQKSSRSPKIRAWRVVH